MNILSNSVAAAFSTAALVAGVRVTYCRGETELEVDAIAGSQTVMQSSDYENLLTKRHRESFILNVADLVDTFGEPAAGDKLKYTPPGREDVVLVFSLRPDDNGGRVFRPTDRFHTRWRVNTLLTDREAA